MSLNSITRTGEVSIMNALRLDFGVLLFAVLGVLISGCDRNRDEPESAAHSPTAPPSLAAHKEPLAPVECRFADGEITIDGVADEPAWKNAVVIDNFYLPWLKDKARPARTKTRAKL